uniref:hypothetical protein n=1 Tax=Vulcanisaeta sp. JCM 14467 TaxID=1295370 RepID=UPI000AB410E4|nr:hypothetical protein [Vulcanisaeta sp. JCM 14467]
MCATRLNKVQWGIVLAAWAGWLLDGYVSIAYALAASIISRSSSKSQPTGSL